MGAVKDALKQATVGRGGRGRGRRQLSSSAPPAPQQEEVPLATPIMRGRGRRGRGRRGGAGQERVPSNMQVVATSPQVSIARCVQC